MRQNLSPADHDTSVHVGPTLEILRKMWHNIEQDRNITHDLHLLDIQNAIEIAIDGLKSITGDINDDNL